MVSSSTSAHKPEGVEFFAPHIPDQILAGMDIDGNFADWSWYPQDLVLTSDIMVSRAGNDPRDIADIDLSFRIAWNESTNKIYLALEAFDDFIHRDTESNNNPWTEDGWTISTDADHSGGFFDGGDLDINDMGSQGQQWLVHPPGPATEMWVVLFGENYLENIENRGGVRAHWFGHPPWGEIVVGPPEVLPVKEGDTDVTLFYEFAWTLFDFLDYGGPDSSVEHILEEDQIIHLGIHYQDHDENGDDWDSQWGLNDESDATRDGSALPDWVMVKVPDLESLTAVEGSTWGQIKSSLK
jgi:hypothetical protein